MARFDVFACGTEEHFYCSSIECDNFSEAVTHFANKFYSGEDVLIERLDNGDIKISDGSENAWYEVALHKSNLFPIEDKFFNTLMGTDTNPFHS